MNPEISARLLAEKITLSSASPFPLESRVSAGIPDENRELAQWGLGIEVFSSLEEPIKGLAKGI